MQLPRIQKKNEAKQVNAMQTKCNEGRIRKCNNYNSMKLALKLITSTRLSEFFLSLIISFEILQIDELLNLIKAKLCGRVGWRMENQQKKIVAHAHKPHKHSHLEVEKIVFACQIGMSRVNLSFLCSMIVCELSQETRTRKTKKYGRTIASDQV